MANMMDYLDWRGDLSMKTDGFNDVDNLLLAQLIYVDFGEIVPGPQTGESIGLAEASERFWQTHEEKEILEKVSMTKSAPFVMRKMAKTKRFADIRLSYYINDISDEEQSQFSVMCVSLEDDSIYVSYSGTDDTIVGWRENFNMGFLAETPGQLKSVSYLNGIAERFTGKDIRVGGHSKGGNLAVYASVNCKSAIRERIVSVYSNDGPGFKREMVESEEFQQMLPRIRNILPESSIVGMLLEHRGDYEVVKSTERGVQQHDAMSWEVLGTSLVHARDVASESILLDETMKNWIDQLNPEERREIVETVFDMLEEAQIYTVDDLYHCTWKQLQEIMKAKSRLPEETQQLFAKALKLLWNTGNKALKRSVKKVVEENKQDSKKSIKTRKIQKNE